jgi:transcriptional regulator with XRE-family HTH domain
MDYSKLRGRIREIFGTQAAFARAMGISECVVSQKLNGRSEWTADEIREAIVLLGIPAEEIPLYFFCPRR